MANIVDVFIKRKNTLLFVLLLGISLFLVFQTHSFQKSKVVNSANFVSGGLYSWSSNIGKYFNLEKDNNRLVEENKTLRQKLLNATALQSDSTYIDTTSYKSSYTIFKADVISNNYSNLDNYLLIDRGKEDSISSDLGVITSQGIIGIIENTSQHYSRVISILNTNLSINAQLKKSNHYGTLKWNGKDPNLLQLIDVPQTAQIEKGDTIITNGRSLIFPKGIPIGSVEDFKLGVENNYYLITVKLFNDMTDVGNVYVIKNNNQTEIDSLMYSNER